MQLSSDAYYADREVPHTAQGDIYAGVPFVHAALLTPAFEAKGARKRPDAQDPDLGVVTSHTGLGVVLHYTCAITAQPRARRATRTNTDSYSRRLSEPARGNDSQKNGCRPV